MPTSDVMTARLDDGAPQFSFAGQSTESVVLELMQEFYPGEGLPYRDDVARAALGSLWREPHLGRVCLMRADGNLAGYAVLTFGFSLEFHGRDALIDELYVREPYRGRGFGTACIRWLERV